MSGRTQDTCASYNASRRAGLRGHTCTDANRDRADQPRAQQPTPPPRSGYVQPAGSSPGSAGGVGALDDGPRSLRGSSANRGRSSSTACPSAESHRVVSGRSEESACDPTSPCKSREESPVVARSRFTHGLVRSQVRPLANEVALRARLRSHRSAVRGVHEPRRAKPAAAAGAKGYERPRVSGAVGGTSARRGRGARARSRRSAPSRRRALRGELPRAPGSTRRPRASCRP